MPKPLPSNSSPSAACSRHPVGEHQNILTYIRVLAPRIHDEHIVHRQARNRVDAFGSNGRRLLDESGQMLGIAGGVNAPGTENTATVLPLNNGRT